jgi:hypothetical protein
MKTARDIIAKKLGTNAFFGEDYYHRSELKSTSKLSFCNQVHEIFMRQNQQAIIGLHAGAISSGITEALTKYFRVQERVLAVCFCESKHGTEYSVDDISVTVAAQCAVQLWEARELFIEAFDKIDWGTPSTYRFEVLVGEPLRQFSTIMLPREPRKSLIVFHTSRAPPFIQQLFDVLRKLCYLLPPWVTLVVVSAEENIGVVVKYTQAYLLETTLGLQRVAVYIEWPETPSEVT